MQPICRILVAVKDPAGKVSPAVIKAAQLATALGARLELFHAIVTPLYVDSYAYSNGSLEDVERDIQARCLAQLGAMAKRLQRHGAAISVAAQWDFPSYEAVVRRATRTKADLIVADLHTGRHGVAGMLHLTDWELLRLSAIPVLLVKNKTPYRNPVLLAAVDPAHTRAKPAGLDSVILTAASDIAVALHGTLHAVHAYIPAPNSIWPTNAVSAASLPKLMAQTAVKARRVLDRAVEAMDIPRSRRHVVGRHPIDAIAQITRQLRSSIVVMGSVSRTGLKGFFVGNTAEKLLDQLGCDVLVVKPPQFKGRVSRAIRGVKLLASASTAFPI